MSPVQTVQSGTVSIKSDELVPMADMSCTIKILGDTLLGRAILTKVKENLPKVATFQIDGENVHLTETFEWLSWVNLFGELCEGFGFQGVFKLSGPGGVHMIQTWVTGHTSEYRVLQVDEL